VARAILFGWADIEHSDLTGSDSSKQLVALDGFHRAARLEVLAGELLELGEACLREPAQHDEEAADLVISDAVFDEEALLLGVDQPSGAQHLKVL
jgi:hypothetical protein